MSTIKQLNILLADEMVLFVQILNYHWNLTGPEFHDYHKFFDEQYHAWVEVIDSVAERIRAIEGKAVGTMREFLNHATLKESPEIPSPQIMIENLLASHTHIIQSLHKTLHMDIDDGTNNFLANLLEQHEKMAWMLRSAIK